MRGWLMPTNSSRSILLATDQQRSVFSAVGEGPPLPVAYMPYGDRLRVNGMLKMLGFNGELPDPRTGHYHLGKGYRQFNPLLMRFNSPDSWSPFGDGGLNAYAYCGGDPINRHDPTGHTFVWLKIVRREFGLMSPPNRRAITVKTVLPRSPDLAQINTQKNMQLPIPGKRRPERISRTQNRLESKRQNHVFQTEHNPDNPTQSIRSKVKRDRKVESLRQKYSRLVSQHHNAARTPVVPERQKFLTFADFHSIHEVEILVPEPVGGLDQLASIRR
ncbi:RHS repeat-associated core domain-containing protein [Pseudomonas sp. GB2N2]